MVNHKIIDVKGLSESELVEKLIKNRNKPTFLDIPGDGIQRLESFSDTELVAFSWLETNAHGTEYGPLDIDKRTYDIVDAHPAIDFQFPLIYVDSEIVKETDKAYKTLNKKIMVGGFSIA